LPVPPAPSALSPLSLHDALPIFRVLTELCQIPNTTGVPVAEARAGEADDDVDAFLLHLASDGGPATLALRERKNRGAPLARPDRSEEHTSELQSRVDLVCRLLLE